jgi:autotransporter translocation and assembly factor TamB
MARSPLKIFGLALMVTVILGLAAAAILRWTPLAVWLANRAVDRYVEPALEMEVEIADVGGDLFNSFSLEDVRIRSEDGREVASIALLSLKYDGRDLIGRRWRLKELILGEPVLHLDTAAPREPPADGRPADVRLPLDDLPDVRLEMGKIIGGRIVGPDGVLAESLILRWSLEIEDGRARLEIPRCVFDWPREKVTLRSSGSGIVVSSEEVNAANLEVRAAGSHLGLSGRLGLSPVLTCSLQVRSDSLSLDEAGRIWAGGGLPSGRLRSSGRLLYDGEVWRGRLRTEGRVDLYRIDRLEGAFSWDRERLRIDELTLQGPGVDLRGRGGLLLESQEPAFEADVILRDVDLSAVIFQAPVTRLNGRLMAAGNGLDPRSLSLDAHVDLDSSMAAGYSLEKVAGRFQFREGIFSTTGGLEIAGQGIRALVAGSLDDQRRIEAAAKVTVDDAGRLFPGRPLSAALNARVQAQGPFDDPQVAGQFELTGVEYDTHHAERIRGSFGLSGAVSRQDGFFALRFFDARLDQVSLSEGRAHGRLKERSLFVDSLFVEGPQGSMSLAGRLNMSDDRLQLTADRWHGRVMDIDFQATEPLEAIYEGESLSLRDVQLSVGTGSLTSEAVIGPGSRISGHLQAERLQTEWLSSLFPGERHLSGPVTVDLAVDGSLDQPHVEAALVWDQGRFERLDLDRFETRLTVTGDSLSVEELNVRRGETELRGNGHLFVDLSRGRLLDDREWDLEIAGQGSDLSVLSLLIEDIQRAEGPFTLQLQATGTPLEPAYGGFFRLQKGTLKMIPLGNEIQKIVLNAHLDGQFLIVDELSAETPIRERNLFKRFLAWIFGRKGRGRAQVRGRVNLAEPAFDLSVTGRRFYVQYLPQEVEAEADLDLRITGRQRPTITGKIDLRRTLVTRSMEAAPGGPPAEGPPPVDLDLTVDIPKNCWLRNESADIEIRGLLRVLQEAESIGLLGTLNTVQGTYYFYGRSFQITRGEVTFDRPEQINPQLDIAARTEVNGEHIDLLISGRLQSPSVTLTSSSGYGEGDIIALLTLQQTGTGLDTLAAKDVVSRQAQSIFGGYLQRAFNRKTGRFLGVETFRIQPDPKDRLNVRQAELTVGTYLSSQFYVEYSRRLSQESGEQVGIEYSLSENLSLQGRRDRDGLYRLGVTARWRY